MHGLLSFASLESLVTMSNLLLFSYALPDVMMAGTAFFAIFCGIVLLGGRSVVAVPLRMFSNLRSRGMRREPVVCLTFPDADRARARWPAVAACRLRRVLAGSRHHVESPLILLRGTGSDDGRYRHFRDALRHCPLGGAIDCCRAAADAFESSQPRDVPRLPIARTRSRTAVRFSGRYSVLFDVGE